MCSGVSNIERQKFPDYYAFCCALERFQLEIGEVKQAAFIV